MPDNDQTALTIEGERIRGKQLTVSAEVPLGELKKLARHDRFAFVGRGVVDEWGIKDVSKVPTRVHKGHATEAVIVADELVEDILGEDVEWTTGQMRLLSVDGEMRRAARLALDERRRHVELGWTVDHDDEHDPDAFAILIEDDLKKMRDAASAVDSFESIPAYFDAIEHELRQVASLAMAGMEWTRRRLEEHLAAEERAEAERQAEEARRVAESMAESTDEEADKRERREIGDDGQTEEQQEEQPDVVSADA